MPNGGVLQMSPGRFSGHSEKAPFVISLKVGLPTHLLAAIGVHDGRKKEGVVIRKEKTIIAPPLRRENF